MQRNSIHNPVQTENAQTQTAFPASGDNFTTIANLEGIPDQLALLEAAAFLDDYVVAITAFENSEDCTGTP